MNQPYFYSVNRLAKEVEMRFECRADADLYTQSLYNMDEDVKVSNEDRLPTGGYMVLYRTRGTMAYLEGVIYHLQG